MAEKIGDSKSKDEIKDKTENAPEEEHCLIESDDLDSVHSGESLLKTFTFKPNENSPEMKKCIAFWQKILEKELKPVKCILVPSKKPQNKEKSEEDTKLQSNSNKEVWMKALEEIKRRKLDELKLVKTREKPVDYCQLLECDMTEKIIINKSEQKREIIELNSWQAHSSPSSSKTKHLENIFKQKILNKTPPPTPRNTVVLTPDKDITKKEEKQAPVEKIEEATNKHEKNIEDVILEELNENAETKFTEELKPTITENKIESSKTEITGSDDEPDMISINNNTEDKICQCGCQFANCLCSDFDYVSNLEGCMCGCQTNSCDCEKYNKLKICECSCELFDCVCQEKQFQTCECSCGLIDCKCEETSNDEKQITIPVIIDNKVIKNENKNDGYCRCECGLSDCICLKLYQVKDDTKCDCGFECLCKKCDSKTTICECFEECKCEETGVKDNSVLSNESSNENIWRLIDVAQAGNVYCTICGYFDCYCIRSKQK